MTKSINKRLIGSISDAELCKCKPVCRLDTLRTYVVVSEGLGRCPRCGLYVIEEVGR